MSEPNPAETLTEYELVVKRLLEHATKEVTGRAARVLASYVGYYQLRHGTISQADLAAVNTAQPGAGEITARVEALRVLAAALTLAAVADTRWD
jgi:hypothetical protein